jgi:hypothetical protein
MAQSMACATSVTQAMAQARHAQRHEGHIEWGTQEPAPCTDAQPVSGSQPVQSSRAHDARRAPQA